MRMCLKVVTPISQLQAKLHNFFLDFATRLRFLRQKRNIALRVLGGGKASTAKSWEGGSQPAPERWDEIASLLELSPSFVFVGTPITREDYDFIAKFADEIEGANEKIAAGTRRYFTGDDHSELGNLIVNEAPDESNVKAGGKSAADERARTSKNDRPSLRVITPSDPHLPLPYSAPEPQDVITYLHTLLDAADGDPKRVGWLMEELHARCEERRRYWLKNPSA